MQFKLFVRFSYSVIFPCAKPNLSRGIITLSTTMKRLETITTTTITAKTRAVVINIIAQGTRKSVAVTLKLIVNTDMQEIVILMKLNSAMRV